MSSKAYQNNARLSESGVNSELADDPWLDDQITTPYPRSALKPRPHAGQAPTARLPALPPLRERPTRPGLQAQRIRPAPTARVASMHNIATPLTAAAATRPRATQPLGLPPLPATHGAARPQRIPLQLEAAVERTPAPATPQPRATSKPKAPKPSAPARAAVSHVVRTARPKVITSPHRATQRLDQTIARMRSRALSAAPEPGLTPDQLSQRAVDAFWRQQERMLSRRSRRNWVVFGGVAGAILCFLLASWVQDGTFIERSWQNLTNLHALRWLSPEQATSPQPPSAAAPEQSAPQPKAPYAQARLRIDSKPVARVFIDDVLIGNTPQLSVTLDPGIHSLRLYNPELARSKHITLDARAGETIDRVELLDP